MPCASCITPWGPISLHTAVLMENRRYSTCPATFREISHRDAGPSLGGNVAAHRTLPSTVDGLRHPLADVLAVPDLHPEEVRMRDKNKTKEMKIRFSQRPKKKKKKAGMPERAR